MRLVIFVFLFPKKSHFGVRTPIAGPWHFLKTPIGRTSLLRCYAVHMGYIDYIDLKV